MTKDEQACLDLLQSIILQAVGDYKWSFRKIEVKDRIKQKSLQNQAYCLRSQCRQFFKSKYFRALCEITEINDKAILKKLRICF